MTPATASPETICDRASKRGEPTWEMARFYPTQGTWTEAEYLALNTNQLIEFSDGCLEFLPMPTPFHQRIVAFLYALLNAFVRARLPGEVFFAPCRIATIAEKYREPDIFYARPERVIDSHQPIKGADLLMEVVSGDPEDRKRDLEEKRAEYEQARIPEYWIVDPQERTITVLFLDGNNYRVHGVFGVGSRATSALLTGFAVSVDEVFAAGEGKLPNS
jgi:Uma2 family endonuclease